MVWLLPAVNRFLQLLSPLKDEHLDSALVSDMSVGFEFLSDAVSDVSGCDGESVELDNFWCLNCMA